MKILVGIKRVVDYNVRVRVLPDGSGVDTDGVKMSVNPFDEIALEEALRLREAGKAEEVVVVSIGSDAAQQQLRTGLAMGADRAILVSDDALAGSDALGTANRGVACGSGLCTLCRADCQGKCETWLSCLCGRRLLYPRDFGLTTSGSANTTAVAATRCRPEGPWCGWRMPATGRCWAGWTCSVMIG